MKPPALAKASALAPLERRIADGPDRAALRTARSEVQTRWTREPVHARRRRSAGGKGAESMADPEVDAIRASLVARPRPADLPERRARLAFIRNALDSTGTTN